MLASQRSYNMHTIKYGQFGRLTAALAVLLAISAVTHGDEGMWLFNYPPNKVLHAKYDFEPDAAWLTHLQQAAVRFNNGGSGSFVSSSGLVMTNHHVAADALQKLSSKDKNLLRNGFYARTSAEEIKCLDLELNVLMSIEDVTARVNAAVRSAARPADAEKLRRAAMNTIEKESFDKTGLRSDVVTLYHGGMYQLYRYKKYTDVRLVFAPEQAIAFFGGDPDNFEYPRYDVDISFFRVYENGQSIKPPHFLKWSQSGPEDHGLVFVAGHPGRTDRMDTFHHLEFLRDRVFPLTLDVLRRREVLALSFSQRSAENARRARDDLFGYQNSRKARLGMLAGLQDPAAMGRKKAVEEAFRRSVAEKPELAAACANAFASVDQSLTAWGKIQKDYDLLERGMAFHSHLFSIARMLVRLSEETAKPNADRLREYAESGLGSLKHALFSEAPIYDDLETLFMADSLGMYVEWAGADNPLVVKVLAGKSPQERAAELVRGTKLADVAVRRQLADGGMTAVKASADPMIQLARLVDKPARRARTTFEQTVEEPQRDAYGKIAAARFALYGADNYPDATFTLRLAFGTVESYRENGQNVPAWTTLSGAFERSKEHGNQEPFDLPQSWLDHRQRLNLDTPMNFVCTADIIGGNSGSPVVNRQGELVGVIFDGNLQSLIWDFVYTEDAGRAIAVHSSVIMEALQKVYAAGPLAKELGR
jgi:hypothetical protein